MRELCDDHIWLGRIDEQSEKGVGRCTVWVMEKKMAMAMKEVR